MKGHLSFKAKLIIAFVLVITIPMIALSVIVYNITSASYFDNLKVSSEQLSNSIRDSITNYMESFEKAATMISNDPNVKSSRTSKEIYDNYSKLTFVKEIVGISALLKKGIDDLLKSIKKSLPVGPDYYPEDHLTDQSERLIVAEMIREKVLMYIDDEIPHGVAVEIQSMKLRSDKPIYDIEADIICEKKSHKGIIIGKEGRKLKGIGKSARQDIERFLGSKVNLQIWVKIREGWRDNDIFLNQLGYKEK